MELIYALIGSILVGGLGIAIVTILWREAKKSFELECAAHDATKEKLMNMQNVLKVSETGRKVENGRLEEIIVELKKDLDAVVKSRDPAEIRARLGRTNK